LGRHSKPSPIRLPNAVPAAAAPTLAGVAAAVFMSPQALAATAHGQAVPEQSAVLGGAYRPALDFTFHPVLPPAELLSAIRQAQAGSTATAATGRKARSAGPAWYTVQPGDSLSSIAERIYHDAAAWPVLYWGNHGQIQWADVIKAGQVLRIPAEPARIPAAPAQLQPAGTYTPRHASPAAAAAPAPAAQAPAQTTVSTSAVSGSWPGGAFGACVVERESGGNPDVWNASGHWGLYQFSASTWAEYGGNPADFGTASAAEQEQVFMNALAQGGEFNWAPYDGC
jgi:LysM repeat protein